jgi:hypothetical protein
MTSLIKAPVSPDHNSGIHPKPPSVCIPSPKSGDTKSLSDKQKWALALAYSYAERHGGEPAPITHLSEVFFDYDRDDYYLSSVKRLQHFQTRRLLQALIKRGLMEEAGTFVHSDAGYSTWSGDCGPGRYHRKGYTRVCKTYRLTDAGRMIGKAEDEAIKASVKATEEANPKLKEAVERVQATLAKIQE